MRIDDENGCVVRQATPIVQILSQESPEINTYQVETLTRWVAGSMFASSLAAIYIYQLKSLNYYKSVIVVRLTTPTYDPPITTTFLKAMVPFVCSESL